MGGLSNDTALLILDAACGGTAFAPSATYLALTTVAVARTDGAGDLVEATYTGYSRLSIADSDWGAAASPGTKTNINPFNFDPCTAGTSDVIGWAMVDSASGSGLVIAYGALGIPLSVGTGITPQFDAGALVINMNPTA